MVNAHQNHLRISVPVKKYKLLWLHPTQRLANQKKKKISKYCHLEEERYKTLYFKIYAHYMRCEWLFLMTTTTMTMITHTHTQKQTRTKFLLNYSYFACKWLNILTVIIGNIVAACFSFYSGESPTLRVNSCKRHTHT